MTTTDATGRRFPSHSPLNCYAERPSGQTIGMGLTDKAKNATEKLTGEAKEAAGRVSDDKSMEAEGKADQTKGDLKQAGEKVKDAFS